MAAEQRRPDNNGGGDGGGSEEVSFGKKLFLFTLLCAAGFLLYQTFGDGLSSPQSSSIPRAMQVTYVPADFKMNLDEAKTLEILSNPQRYKTEFDKLILDFNTNLVVHVTNRMGLNNQLKTAAISEYRKMHPYVRQMYFNDFVGLSDTTSQIYATWYESGSTSAVDLLNEVASKYTCFFITNVITTILKTQDGKLSVKGSKVETPCGIALTEGVRPLVARLQKTAAIRDFSQARGLMRERVERAITELAVLEVKDKKGIKVQNKSKLLGYNVSSTEFDLVAVSIMKIGFNLQQSFNVTADDRTKTIIITLPQPQILSHEVYPKVENLDIGFMRDLTSQDFNDNINKLRQAFREDIQQGDEFEKAKKRATEVMQLMMQPAVRNIDKSYKVAVRFQQPQSLDYDLPADQQQRKQQQTPQIRQPNAPQKQPQRVDGRQ